MYIYTGLKCIALTFAVFAAMGVMGQDKAKRKWLVLDPVTYGKGVQSVSFSGIDGLLLTKLADARKYSVLDKDAAKTGSSSLFVRRSA